jgi:hypothetical protein
MVNVAKDIYRICKGRLKISFTVKKSPQLNNTCGAFRGRGSVLEIRRGPFVVAAPLLEAVREVGPLLLQLLAGTVVVDGLVLF